MLDRCFETFLLLTSAGMSIITIKHSHYFTAFGNIHTLLLCLIC